MGTELAIGRTKNHIENLAFSRLFGLRYLHNEIVGRADWGYKRKSLGLETAIEVASVRRNCLLDFKFHREDWIVCVPSQLLAQR